MKKFNIALTFDDEYNQKIINYSKKLYGTSESDIILGLNARPHLTIAQFEATEKQALEIWNKFQNISINSPTLILSGINILPSRNSGGIWIEISVLKTKELIEIQNFLLLILNQVNGYTSGVGDNYRPHITIAHIPLEKNIKNIPIDCDVTRLKNLKTFYNIGLGEKFNETDIIK